MVREECGGRGRRERTKWRGGGGGKKKKVNNT
jgi:hypothetical protein